MIIIALDLGVTTGIAIGDDMGNLTLSGTKKLKNRLKNPVEGFKGESRFMDFYRWLKKAVEDIMVKSNDNILIVTEKTNKHMPGFSGVSLHFGLQACVTLIQEAHPHTISLETVSAKSIKKFWTGNGNASKKQMVDKANEEYPDVTPITDDNEADSIALYRYMQENLYERV